MNELGRNLETAIQYYRSGNYAAAEPILKQVLEIQPDNAIALECLGQIHADRGSFSSAIQLKTRLLDVVSQEASKEKVELTVQDLAELYRKIGRFEEAEQVMRREVVATAPPASVEALQAVGLAEETSTSAPSISEAQTREILAPYSERMSATDSSTSTAQLRMKLEARRDREQITQPEVEFEPPQNYSDTGKHRAAEPEETEQVEEAQAPKIARSKLRTESFNRLRQEENTSDEISIKSDQLWALASLCRKGSEFMGAIMNIVLGTQPERNNLDISSGGGGPGSYIILFIVILSMGIYFVASPRKITFKQAYQSMPHKFCSADGEQTLVIAPHDCELTVRHNTLRVPYNFFLGDWRDVATMAFTPVVNKQYWITKSDTALVDEDGQVFYAADGPVPKLIDYMELISRSASLWYSQHHDYPDDDAVAQLDLSYTNPCTNKKEYFKIQKLNLGKPGDSAADSNQARLNMLALLAHGQTWQGEPALSPGCINCCSVTIPSPGGDLKQFFIQACDQSGKPLGAGQSGKSYFVVLENGQPQSKETPNMPAALAHTSMRSPMIWIIAADMDASMAWVARNGGAIFFGIFTFFVLLFWVSGRTKRFADHVPYAVAILLCVLITGLYAANAKLPF